MNRPARLALGTLVLASLGGFSCERAPRGSAEPAARSLGGRGAAADPGGAASYPVGAQPRAVAVADLDGDGELDVAVANSADGTVTVLMGAGQGRLRPVGAPVPAGREPSDVDAADLDRDGDVDLVLANHETSRITLLLNDGRARFTPAAGSPVETGARPHVHGLATADLDGDGWTDVAVESADTREVRILWGGAGGFGPAVAVDVGTMPYFRLGAADATGDGRLDVLVPGHGDSTVLVVGAEQGRELRSERVIRLADQPWMIVGADVNGDRRADLVVVHAGAVSVWMAASRGFAAAPGSPFSLPGATEAAAGDLDGDGVADVVAGPWEGDEVTVLAGPRLERRAVRACPRPIGLAVADLDGDGRGELLAVCPTENRLVVITTPPGR
ncbi:MAG TPA: VCBS repeat-containing protein [Longimicrobium sp.]